MKRSLHYALLNTAVLSVVLFGQPLAAKPLTDSSVNHALSERHSALETEPRHQLHRLERGLTRKLSSEPSRTKQAQNQRSTILDVDGQLTQENEALQDGSYFQPHTFSGRAGQQVEIRLNSTDFDPYLFLIDPDGEVLAEHDDISAENRNATVAYTLPGNGVYTIVVNTSGAQQTGNYNLAMTTVLGTGAFQATLSWRSTDDLDLVVRSPNGDLVSFEDQQISSGGRLDVDSNAQCRGVTATPVENVFWPPNGAPTGEYTVVVSLYQRCANTQGPIPFTLRLTVQGEVQTFEGVVSEEEDIVFFDTAVY